METREVNGVTVPCHGGRVVECTSELQRWRVISDGMLTTSVYVPLNRRGLFTKMMDCYAEAKSELLSLEAVLERKSGQKRLFG